MLSFDSNDRLSEGISQILSSVFPKRQIRSLRVLEGGKTNSNVLVEFENCHERLVLRQHLRGQDVCLKEVSVLQLLRGVVPVAEVIDFGTMKDQSHNTYLLYAYVPGQHFRKIRASGSSRDMAEAAFSIGRCLSVLGKVDASSLVDEGLLQRFGFSTDVLESPVLRERLGMEDCDLLQRLHSEWLPVLQNFANEGRIVHGDFNHRNIVLKKTQKTWKSLESWTGSLPRPAAPFWILRASCATKGPTQSGGKLHFSKAFVHSAQCSRTIAPISSAP